MPSGDSSSFSAMLITSSAGDDFSLFVNSRRVERISCVLLPRNWRRRSRSSSAMRSDSLVMVPWFRAALRSGIPRDARNFAATGFPVFALKNARRYVHEAREDVVHAQLGPRLAIARG